PPQDVLPARSRGTLPASCRATVRALSSPRQLPQRDAKALWLESRPCGYVCLWRSDLASVAAPETRLLQSPVRSSRCRFPAANVLRSAWHPPRRDSSESLRDTVHRSKDPAAAVARLLRCNPPYLLRRETVHQRRRPRRQCQAST